MEILKGLIDLIGENGQQLIEAVAYIVLAVSIAIKLIPTLDKENRFLPFVKWAAKYLALDNGRIPDEDRPSKKE